MPRLALSLTNVVYYLSSDQKQAYIINYNHPTQCPVGSYSATVQNFALCLVDTSNTTFYLDDPRGPVYKTKLNGCSIGVDDSANCHLGWPPANTTPKLDHQRFYYTR